MTRAPPEQPTNGQVVVPANRPPRISFSLPEGGVVATRTQVDLVITIEDPEGDPVSLFPILTPATLEFDPVVNSPSPAVVSMRWIVLDESAGRERLVFAASDGQSTRRETLTLTVSRSDGNGSPDRNGMLFGDVTGDGSVDTVCVARVADPLQQTNSGALYVWRGGAPLDESPSATLFDPAGAAGDHLGGTTRHRGFELADVTGDGILDVLAASDAARNDKGLLHVFEGGAQLDGDVAPAITLLYDEPLFADGFRMQDVTGDGYPEVLAVEREFIAVWDVRSLGFGTHQPSAVLGMPFPLFLGLEGRVR